MRHDDTRTILFLFSVYPSCLLTCSKSPSLCRHVSFFTLVHSFIALIVVVRVLNMEELQWTEEEEESAEHPYYNNIPGKMPPPGGIIDTRLINQNAAPDACQVPLCYRKLLITQEFSTTLSH